MTELDRMLRGLAEEQDAMRAASRTHDRQRLLHGVLRPRQPAARFGARHAALAFALLSALLAVGLWRFRSHGELSLRVGREGTPGLVGAWFGAPDDSPLPLEFSDGTRVDLSPRARARLLELRPEGARIQLENGQLRVHVVHGAQSRWALAAGPFGVQVTGTRFDVSYDPAGDRFELTLHEGAVVLTGCVFGPGRKLAAGQTVRASCGKAALQVEYGGPAPLSAASTPPAAASASSERSVVPTVSAEKPSTAEAAALGRRAPEPLPRESVATEWLVRARRGEFREALATAEAAGFESIASKASVEDLLLLAHASLHARSPERAALAWSTLRRRFAGSREAAVAAFKLGQLDFDSRRAFPSAGQWFRIYLREQPGGALTREAMGRLLEVYERTSAGAPAKELAQRYLREYASGPHAELATRLAAEP